MQVVGRMFYLECSCAAQEHDNTSKLIKPTACFYYKPHTLLKKLEEHSWISFLIMSSWCTSKELMPHNLVEMKISHWSILPKCHCSNSKWYSIVCLGPTHLYACRTTWGHLMSWWIVSWGIPSQMLTRASLSFWTVWRINLVATDEPKCNIPGFLLGSSQWYQFLHPPGTASILNHIRLDIFIH